MKILQILILTFSISLLSQNDIESNFEKLYTQKQYEEIIQTKPTKDWNGKAYYYKAMSHYMTNDDDNTIKFMDMALNIGPIDHDMYYYKGMSLFYKEDYKKSLPLLKKSIELLPNEPAFYKSVGEVYYKLNEIDSTYAYLKKAVNLDNATIDVYSYFAETCFELKKYEEAFNYYKEIIEVVEPMTEQHHLYSYNLCLIEQLKNDYVNAEANLKKLISFYPNDYQAKAKLIQVLVAQNKYESAYRLRDELYLAYEQNKLPNEFKSRFCFEQFEWGDMKVFAYENFKNPEDSEKNIFNKHQFFIYDNEGNYLYEINSESSFAVRMNKDIKYVLALKNSNGFKTFWQFSFKETDYKFLKESVLKILNNEVKPGSSTTFN